jgi:hypothetical protein
MVCAFCFAETVFPLLIPLLKERLRVGEDEIAVCNGANLRAKETSASFHSKYHLHSSISLRLDVLPDVHPWS